MSSKNKVLGVKEEFGLTYDAKDIGKRITELREKKKWSAHKLAYRSCVDNAVLIRIEKGEREPMMNTILKIIDGLGLSVADFFKVFRDY